MGRHLVFAILLGALALPPGGAQAAGPTTQEIIEALRPGADQPGLTRGIRPVVPGAPASAPSINIMVTFATGSAQLTPDAMRMLDSLGRALGSPELAGYRFRVEGHTDTVGSAALNQALSERRAAAVVDYLATRHGIPPARLEPFGLGESAPLVPTGDEVDEPRNRRVQVVNIGA